MHSAGVTTHRSWWTSSRDRTPGADPPSPTSRSKPQSPSTPTTQDARTEIPLLDPGAAPILTGMAELARYSGEALQDSALATEFSSGEIVTVNVGDEVELVDPALPN